MRRVLTLAMLAVAALPGADVSGIWIGQFVTGRRNSIQDVAFKFTQQGATLGGKVYLDYGSTPIIKGAIEGDQITFYTIAREQEGNQINETLLKFTGTIKEGEIEVTREREELRNAGNSGASFSRNTKQTFRIKRLM